MIELVKNDKSVKIDVDTIEVDSTSIDLTPEEKEVKLKEIDAKITELNNKANKDKFLFAIKDKYVDDVIDFLENDVQWKGMESKGVIELIHAIKESRTDSKNNGYNGLMLENVVTEALAYFIQEYKGVGNKIAKKLSNIIDPLRASLQAAKKIRDEIEKLQQDFIAIDNGISIVDDSKLNNNKEEE